MHAIGDCKKKRMITHTSQPGKWKCVDYKHMRQKYLPFCLLPFDTVGSWSCMFVYRWQIQWSYVEQTCYLLSEFKQCHLLQWSLWEKLYIWGSVIADSLLTERKSVVERLQINFWMYIYGRELADSWLIECSSEVVIFDSLLCSFCNRMVADPLKTRVGKLPEHSHCIISLLRHSVVNEQIISFI